MITRILIKIPCGYFSLTPNFEKNTKLQYDHLAQWNAPTQKAKHHQSISLYICDVESQEDNHNSTLIMIDIREIDFINEIYTPR